LLALAAVAGLTEATLAGDSSSDRVIDTVGLFRPKTIDRADALIRELKQQYHFDVRVETLQLGDVERKQVEGLSHRRAKARYFADLGRQRAEDANVNGLYILISTAPRYVQVTVSPHSAEGLFSNYQQRQLHKLLVAGLSEARPGDNLIDAATAALGIGWRERPGADRTLIDAVKQVQNVLRYQAGDPNALRASTVGVILAAGVGLWAILGLVSRRMSDRHPHDGLLRPDESHLTPALLASRFGTPTGYWLYDRLYQSQPVAQEPISTASRHSGLPPEVNERISTIVPSVPGHAEAAPDNEPA
jgi:hypothetical protein